MADVRPAPPAEALALLEASAPSPGLGAVDEDEERRLRGLPPFRGDGWTWEPWLYGDAGRTGYVGLLRPPVPPAPGVDVPCAVVELATPTDAAGRDAAAVAAGITAARSVAGGPVQIWLRAARPSDLAAAADLGAVPVRTMRVLARPLADLPTAAPVPAGVVVRPWRPGDDPGVVAVLAAAHPARARHWTSGELDRRRSAAWFRPDDLLVADAGGGLLGVHWTKRRDATTGEVHNLALHPDAQGRGLGGALLDAGLHHLAGQGLREVLLWVDDANPTALALYVSRGFVERCRDVLLEA
jgi:mycothiol synthase